MIGTYCFIVSCITYCVELVAKPGGNYSYTDPYPAYIDYACMEKEISGLQN